MSDSLAVQHYVPAQTLQCYLDSLLQEAAADLALAEQSMPDVPVSPAAEARTPQALSPVTVPVETPAVSAEPEPTPQAAAPVPGGSWREQPFDALLFNVGGLTLAVPLVSLGSIHPLDGPITPLFGQPDWFLGLLPTGQGNLRVVDTARWVMPERYHPELREELRYVISIQGFDWGLAVHSVSESIRLDPAQVKWRSGAGKRPWLAGTVIDHMCALLDVGALAALISHSS